MARNRLKSKGRRDGGRFARLPEVVLKSPECHGINGEGLRLLAALAAQYNGHNNGDLSAALSVLREFGFTSSGTISTNLRKLEEVGLIVRTRDGLFCGGVSVCALYALAWLPIDACPGKRLQVGPTQAPPRTFRPAVIAKRPVRNQERADAVTGPAFP